jgi:cbb3-type cytochrome oxidase subunit 3
MFEALGWIILALITGLILGFFVGIWAFALGIAQKAKEKLSKEEVTVFLNLVKKLS